MSLFTPEEAFKWLESLICQLPESDEKFKTLQTILWTSASVVRDDRESLIAAIKIWLERGKDPFLPLIMAVSHKLIELRPILEAVDINALPVYSVTPYSSKEQWRRLLIELKRMGNR